MKDTRKAEEIAVNRHKIIAPIMAAMEENADAAKLMLLKNEACEQNGIHRRTLGRWLEAYQQHGFEGLKPVGRDGNARSVIPDSLIEEAILLRREVPSRSIPQIIEILEMEGKAPTGLLKRTTLQDKLQEKGYSARQMKMYQQGGLAARRFQRQNRGDMWHSDIKFAMHLTIGGAKKQTYLVSFLDDATRYVVHGEFYDSLDQTIVEDCFRKAVLKEGVPRRVYFDQGKQFKNKWMNRACAVLGVKLLFAKPYSPESTGKIERFNRTVDSFLDEAALKNCKTLDDYNRYFNVWLAECYHTRVHGGLKGATPEIAYKTSKAPLRFVSPETVASAFMRVETRKVDKSGCISFCGKKYEVSALLAGRTVDVAYDPNDIQTLTVEHDGKAWLAQELKIGEHTGPRPKLPKTMLPALPGTSRLLDEKEKRHTARRDAARRAIRYSGLEGGGGNV
ncbi:MAG: DDE-type integrase/transposase/recombinase [Betaproteobacteria bacterium]|nr:DDE-type integrase/transposase/recombinase [Betaproteobacteria bacterium]